jgi:hypothetical protein
LRVTMSYNKFLTFEFSLKDLFLEFDSLLASAFTVRVNL